MADPAGTWGLYQWFREYGEQLIHPDDLGAFERLQPNSKVFLCEEEQAGYLVLQYDQERYRVKPDLFKPVAPPKRIFRERVWVLYFPRLYACGRRSPSVPPHESQGGDSGSHCLMTRSSAGGAGHRTAR